MTLGPQGVPSMAAAPSPVLMRLLNSPDTHHLSSVCPTLCWDQEMKLNDSSKRQPSGPSNKNGIT